MDKYRLLILMRYSWLPSYDAFKVHIYIFTTAYFWS